MILWAVHKIQLLLSNTHKNRFKMVTRAITLQLSIYIKFSDHGPHILSWMNETRYIHQFFYLDHLNDYWQQKIENLHRITHQGTTEMEERPCPQPSITSQRGAADQGPLETWQWRPPRRWNQLRTARGGLINNYNDIAFSSALTSY